jgi:hypothetical protein
LLLQEQAIRGKKKKQAVASVHGPVISFSLTKMAAEARRADAEFVGAREYESYPRAAVQARNNDKNLQIRN